MNDPTARRYGYELSRETGLASGTLYPILMRLTEQGLLEADWEPSDQPGRPPRHLYRLTGDGVALAKVRLAEAVAKSGNRATRNRTPGMARVRPA